MTQSLSGVLKARQTLQGTFGQKLRPTIKKTKRQRNVLMFHKKPRSSSAYRDDLREKLKLKFIGYCKLWGKLKLRVAYELELELFSQIIAMSCAWSELFELETTDGNEMTVIAPTILQDHIQPHLDRLWLLFAFGCSLQWQMSQTGVGALWPPEGVAHQITVATVKPRSRSPHLYQV